MQELNNKNHKLAFSKTNILVFFALLLYSFGLLFIISKNSPMYHFNDWVDLNAFETVGWSWRQGVIPYRDLFEQKGPALYLIFVFTSLSKGFLGTYIAEALFMTATLVILYFTARLKMSVGTSVIFSIISETLITMSPFFKTGGSAEEFMFPEIAFSLYIIVRVAVKGIDLPQWVFIVSGVSIAVMFWTKYTVIGGFLGLYFVLLILMLWNRRIKRIFLALIDGFLGFLVLTVPIIGYFVSHNAFRALIHDYFYANIVLYPNESSGIIGKILSAIFGLFHTLYGQPIIFLVMVGGIAYVALSNKLFKTSSSKILFLGSYFCMIIATLMGGKVAPYYFLPVLPYMTIPVLNLMLAYENKIRMGNLCIIALLFFVTTVGLNYNVTSSIFFPTNSTVDLHHEKQEPFQISFSKIIKSKKHATLLNYNSLDMGLYKASGTLPSLKFFEKQNIPVDKLPEMMDSQNEAVDEQKIDFVVTRIHYGSPVSVLPLVLKNNYKIVETRDANVSGVNFTVLLLERKSNF